MTETMNGARTSSRLRRWTVGGFLFVLVLLGAYGTYRFALNQMVQGRLQAIRDRGEPATWAEVVALYPPPEVEADNAAVLLREAAASLVALDEAVMDRIPTFNSEVEPPAHDEPIPAETLDAMGQYVAVNDRAFELVAEAGQRPVAWYGRVRIDGPLNQVTPLGDLRRLARSLDVAVMWQAEQGKIGESMVALHGMIIIAESLRDEPLFLDQLVRMSIYEYTHQALQRTLSRRQLGDAQLRGLAVALEGAVNMQPLTMAMIAERCLISDQIQMPAEVMSEHLHRSYSVIVLHRLLGLVAIDHMRYLDILKQFIAATRLPRDQVLFATSQIASTVEEQAGYAMTLDDFGAYVSGVVRGYIRSIDRIETMRVALAIERYRVAEGALPASLEALVPTYLEAVPIGAFDGLPVVYERLPDGGYVLHSEDRNGGRERFEVRR